MANTVYNVSGSKYKYEVYKPDTGTKFYVRKISKEGKRVGKDAAFSNKDAAIREADRKARDDGRFV